MKTLVKSVWLLASVLALSGVPACSQDGSQAAGRRVLDEKVPQLPVGASVEEVEGHLGIPRNRAVLEDGETSLYYGLWQLFFDPGLFSRVRYYSAGHWPKGRSVKQLDRDVSELKMKSSLAAVERHLGKPESWQIQVPGKKEDLWYGPGRWKLVFSRGKLVRKVLYEGGSPTQT